MYIKYLGESNQYLTQNETYYSHYYGYDEDNNYFICIRDNDNVNHIITKDYEIIKEA